MIICPHLLAQVYVVLLCINCMMVNVIKISSVELGSVNNYQCWTAGLGWRGLFLSTFVRLEFIYILYNLTSGYFKSNISYLSVSKHRNQKILELPL